MSSKLDGMVKKTAKNKVNKILARKTKGVFSDDNWSNVTAVFDELNAEGIIYELTSADYGHDAKGTPTSKTWKIKVPFVNAAGNPMEMFGVVIASGCGSVKDPLDRYDLVAYVS